MKILFLGGAGGMARAMAELMKGEDAIETVTIADVEERV